MRECAAEPGGVFGFLFFQGSILCRSLRKNKGGIVDGFCKDSCVQLFWGRFAQGALALLCPPTQVLYCSHEERPSQWQAGNLSMICRGDCHSVGRLGRSASAHTAAP